jgi:hypothetical protein
MYVTLHGYRDLIIIEEYVIVKKTITLSKGNPFWVAFFLVELKGLYINWTLPKLLLSILIYEDIK